MREELCADDSLARQDERIETNRYDGISMTLPPGCTKGAKQSRLLQPTGKLLPKGNAIA